MISDISNNVVQPTLIYPEITDISQNQFTNILLIDRNVPSYQTFVDSANDSTFPIVFSNDCSGNELIDLLRNRFSSIQRIGLCFTINIYNGMYLFLNNEMLFPENLSNPEPNVSLILNLIQEFGVQHIDFLACDTLQFPIWCNYYNLLEQSTGVIVGASDDKTGNIKYGGDWILESTSEDIETIYFTQSIAYYQYLLDNLTWSVGISNILTLATDGTYIYTGGDNNQLRRVPIATGVVDPNWRTPVTYNTYGMAAYNGNIYLANRGVAGSITRISIADPSNNVTTSWFTYNSSVYGNPTDCRVNGNFLYLGVSSTILRYDLTAGQGATATVFATSTQGVVGGTAILMAFDTSYMYVASYDTMVIARISLTNPSTVYTTNFCTGLAAGLSSLVHSNGYLYMSRQINAVRYARINVSNLTDSSYNIAPTVTAQYVRGAVANGYNVYMGYNAGIIQFDVPFSSIIPSSVFTIDTGNTKTVASGNLQVAMIDATNILQNNVYYWYSTNVNSTYANTLVKNNGPTQTNYTFFVNGLTSAVNTIYVIARNNVGNSNPVSAPVIVYSAPFSPTSYSASFSLDTGLQVSITDTNNQSTDNVYYYYYYFRVGDTAPNQSGNIAVYSNSYATLSANSSASSFYIPNLMKGDYNIYVAAVNSYGANIYTPAIPPVSVICFKEDSRILTNKGYKKIQHLKKGDLVKTFQHGFKPVHQLGKKVIEYTPTLERSKNHLYKCSPEQYPEVFEDLVLTGCHSILVDDFIDEEQIRKTEDTLGSSQYMTDGKLRLPVCADRRASIYEHPGKYTVYHVALENDDYYMNYGIYANGLLVESTSKRFLDQFQIMEK